MTSTSCLLTRLTCDVSDGQSRQGKIYSGGKKSQPRCRVDGTGMYIYDRCRTTRRISGRGSPSTGREVEGVIDAGCGGSVNGEDPVPLSPL